MLLKIRTIYFKTKDIKNLKDFYAKLFGIQPKLNKNSDDWVEFDFGNVNLSFISLPGEKWEGSNCVPVFEIDSKTVNILKVKVQELGGIVLDQDYDGFTSVLCKDIEGNEFEITSFND